MSGRIPLAFDPWLGYPDNYLLIPLLAGPMFLRTNRVAEGGVEGPRVVFSKMPSREEILDQVYEVLKPHNKKGQTLNEDTELVGDLDLDSVQVLELLLEIEDHFDISIPLNTLPNIHTVRDLAGELEKITGSPS